MATVLALVGACVFSVLAGAHVFLISTGQTTWEFIRRDRIDYLKHLSPSAQPFSEGLLGNWSRLLLAPHRLVARDWEAV